MKHTIQRVCCCLLLAILPLPLLVGAQPQAVSNVQQAKRLIVKIRAKNEFGAGIIFSLRGGYLFIATAKHVVMDSPRALGELTVEFEFLRGVAVPAEFFQADTIFDLAVLRVDVGNSRLRDAAGVTLPFDLLGKTVALQPGDQVYPVGHPEGAPWDVPLTPSVMKQVNYEQLRLEPACLKGQSGGGLFDADWKLAGMISRTRGLTCEALSFERICGTLEHDWGLVVNREPLPLISDPPAPTTPSVVEQQQEKIAALLEQAEIYFSKVWYTTPPGTNAFDLYLEVLRLDPDNQQAWRKIEQMRAFYKSRAEQAEQQGNPQKAIRYYERYLKIEPNDDEVLDKLYALQTPEPPRPTSMPTPRPTALPAVVPTLAPTTPTPANTWADSMTGMEFARMPAGCFQMGSPEDEEGRDGDEGPVHEVCVDEFWMGKYEITQAQWQKIMGNNPSHFKGENRPVERVSWNDAQEFITQLNRQSGHTFRLPTEAEWEYAARAGTTTPFYFGETISTDQANYDGNYVYGHGKKGIYRGETTDVGSFPANAFGLYDMHGNVWEWCQDVYDSDAYKNHARHNPVGASGGSERVRRGGSWLGYPRNLRSANRDRYSPSNSSYTLGFRLARTN